MSKYRVKQGHHFVAGKLYVAGDTVEIDNENFAVGDRAKFFEKMAAESDKVADAPKRGGKKAKAEAAESAGDEGTTAAGEDAAAVGKAKE